jgi:hypothetical protein
MPYVLYQMKIQEHVVKKLEATLAEALVMHREEMQVVEFMIAKHKPWEIPASLRREREVLIARGRRISIHNLLRIAVDKGLYAVDSTKDALALMAKHGISVGRPRGTR